MPVSFFRTGSIRVPPVLPDSDAAGADRWTGGFQAGLTGGIGEYLRGEALCAAPPGAKRTTNPMPKKIRERKKRQIDMTPPHQAPLSEPPLSPQLPLSEPPESHEPLSEPPQSHEPLSEPLESHHEPSSELPESQIPPDPPLLQKKSPPFPPPARLPDPEQTQERMQRKIAMIKNGAARLIRSISCLLGCRKVEATV
jgi:hypothetical protein